MNKTQQLLKSREEEFDKEFSIYYAPDTGERDEVLGTPDEIKSFHATTISLLLNSLKEEVAFMIEKEKACNLDNDLYEQSYTRALNDISTLLSETISNIQTK